MSANGMGDGYLVAALYAERAMWRPGGVRSRPRAPIRYVAELVGADTDKGRGKPTTGQIAPHLTHGHRVQTHHRPRLGADAGSEPPTRIRIGVRLQEKKTGLT
jgi:hypothetical protein